MKGSFHTFKTTGDIFYLEEDMNCKSSDLIYVVICSTWNEEYMGEAGEEKKKARDRYRVYRQHIRQPQYQQLKCEEHFWTCGKGESKIFSLFKLHSQNKYLREQYEKYFRYKFKPMLH